jgi:hypothetical protein
LNRGSRGHVNSLSTRQSRRPQTGGDEQLP